jgi:nucleotide-binding universal stress UspA family protein
MTAMSDSIGRILVAYDGSEPARRALAVAAELACRFRVPLGVVSVVLPRPPILPRSHCDEVLRLDQLDDARRLLEPLGITPELIQPIGDPARTIERLAAMGGFDTIVVGCRRLGSIARAVRGSVSEHVAVHADATVIVVR